ncbi:hypothetical protein [Aquibacillus rhizosphaerae]|uniref:DUF4352 domain-containing protein n=1 Tax=Aquibacillus rhizosphaerae TaxID=3051431 RepID=A0ABT7L7D0_9BACI|nr:hypothetical protein [Aquibacillus sp. LR5S19]MDL4841767.1 hypothetical protein [Aquibacillus sp. LR5S19]
MIRKLTVITTLLAVFFLAACQNEPEITNETEVQEDENKQSSAQQDMNEVESSPFSYGAGVKGGQYGITLQTAYSNFNEIEESNYPYMVTAVVDVKNVTQDKELNPGTIAFTLSSKNQDASYQGVLPENVNPSDLTLEPDENISLQVVFEVESIEEDFIVTASIFNEQEMEAQWKLEGLNTFQ